MCEKMKMENENIMLALMVVCGCADDFYNPTLILQWHKTSFKRKQAAVVWALLGDKMASIFFVFLYHLLTYGLVCIT